MSEQILGALENIEAAVARVEEAVKERSIASWVSTIFIALIVLFVPRDLWHSKWRYALTYGVSESDVHVAERPNDCDFMTAPLGIKSCHYEGPIVSTVRWAKSTSGNPIVSNDEGKTWTPLIPDAGTTVPTYSTVKSVFLSWEKKDN